MTNLSAMKVKILEGFKLILLYSDYCTSNLASVITNDEENDSVYFSAIINNVTLNQIPLILDKQNWQFDLFVNTSYYSSGNYSMKLIFWDIFYEENPNDIFINLELANSFPPEFVSDLPSIIKIQICTNFFLITRNRRYWWWLFFCKHKTK